MKVVVTRTAKNIVRLKYDNGTLRVVANYFVTQKKIRRIIEENMTWINMRKDKEQELNKHPREDLSLNENALTVDAKSDLIDSQVIKEIFAGRKTIILGDVLDVRKSVSNKTYMEGASLFISEKSYSDRESRIKAIKSYLRKISLLYVASEVSSFGSKVSLCPSKIDFKDVSGGWVNCSLSSQRNLSLDYRITQLPQDLRTYLIAHAFAHFYIPSHDENFWNYLSNILPRYQDNIKDLEQYDFLKDI